MSSYSGKQKFQPQTRVRQIATHPPQYSTGAGHLFDLLSGKTPEVTAGILASQWGRDTRLAVKVTAISHMLLKGAK